MYQEKVVLCGASAYEQKYYFNQDFASLPEAVKQELQIMCVLYTEDIGGVLTLEFDEEGELQFKTEALDMKVSATILTTQTPVVIKIGGTMSNPSGKLDVASTAVSLVGGILNYKTPIKVVQSTGKTTQAVVTKTTDTAVDAVNTAVDAVKSIGSLFKSKKKEEKEDKAQ